MRIFRICCVAIALTVSGCASVPAACPRLPLPAPVGDQVHLVVEGGRVAADAGGERLLRDYLGLRSMIRQLWYE